MAAHSRIVHGLALLALLFAPTALAEDAVDTECVEGACPSIGTSALQAKQIRESVKEDQSSEDAEGTEEGMEVENFHGAQIIVSANSDVKKKGVGNWIITIKEGCTDEDVKQLAEHMPAGTVPVYSGSPSEGGLCMFVMTGTKEQVLEELASHELPMDQVICEADQPIQAIPEIPGEEGASMLQGEGAPGSWGIDRIDDRSGLDNDYKYPGKGGEGVHVYVLDTGVRVTHSEFEGRAIPGWDMTSGGTRTCNGKGDTGCAPDRQGHGTHCAGTIAGKTMGVAPKAIVYGVKVLGDSGSGQFSWISEGVDKIMAASTSPKIASMSLGGKGNSPSMTSAITKAVEGGVTVVVAAGNDGRTATPDACKYTPAGIPAAITVGATQKGDSRASYSNWGTCIDIFAPGSDIIAAGHAGDSATKSMSGTSMACPHVAGAAALYLSDDKSRKPTDVLKIMLDMSSSDIIKDTRSGSPNKFLYVEQTEPAKPGDELKEELAALKEQWQSTKEEIAKMEKEIR